MKSKNANRKNVLKLVALMIIKSYWPLIQKGVKLQELMTLWNINRLLGFIFIIRKIKKSLIKSSLISVKTDSSNKKD